MKHYDLTRDICERLQLDAVLLSETKMRDHACLTSVRESERSAQSRPPFRFVATHVRPCPEGRSGPDARPAVDASSGFASRSIRYPQAGVMWMVFNPAVTITSELVDSRGVVAVSLRKDGLQPIAVIGLYNPPTGSSLNREVAGGERTWSESVLAAATDAARMLRARKCFQTVMITGDLNMRIGTHGGARNTEDAAPFTGGRTGHFRDFMAAVSMIPVHGRPGQPAGHLTSRVVTATTEEDLAHGNAEVDYWLAPADACGRGPSGRDPPTVQALPQGIPWSDIPQSMSHTPVQVVINLQAQAAEPRAPAPRTSVYRAPFLDRRWATEWNPRLLRWARELNSPPGAGQLSVDAEYGRAVRTLSRESHAVFDGRDTRERTGIRDPLRCTAAAAHALREQLDAAKREYRIAHERYRSYHNMGAPSAEAFTLAKQRNRRAHKRVKALQAEAQQHAVIASALKAEHQRRVDPHSMYKSIDALAQEDPAISSSDGLRQGLDLGVVTDHYARILHETRDPPPAIADEATRAEWAPFLPKERVQGAGQRLAAPVQPFEVYLCIYPACKELLDHLAPCEPGCPLCSDYSKRLASYRHGDPLRPPPKWVPTLNMCKAAGSDGLIGELLRFSRDPDHKNRWEQRMEVCGELATLFNRWMTEGVPTSGDFSISVLTALLKRGTPGAPVDPRNPADTRPISVGNLLPRVFDLVLLSRFSHWALNQGIVSTDMQAGFIPTLSAEQQVLAMVETVTMQKHGGLDTSVLFIDISGAYDDVHQGALWHILEHAGVPASLTGMFRRWWSGRKAKVKVDGRISAPIDQNKGGPQGNVLMPLFWNIYFEPLLRKLAASSDGVTVTMPSNTHGAPSCSATIKVQAYADDVGAVSTSVDNAQRCVDALMKWAKDWRMRVNVKPGKTQAVLIRGAGAAGAPAPLNAGTAADGKAVSVTWAERYRYLGLPMTSELAWDAFIDKRVAHINFGYAKYFRYNSVINRLPLCAQVQLLQTLVISGANYLVGVLPTSDAQSKRMDAAARRIVRRIFGIPDHAPNALVDAEVPFLPFRATIDMHLVRTYLSIKHNPFQDTPAARIVRFQEEAAVPPHAFVRRAREVIARVQQRVGSGEDAAPLGTWLEPDSAADIRNSVGVMRRGIAYRTTTTFMRNGGAAGGNHGAKYRATAAAAALRPPATPPTAHVAALHCVGLITQRDLGKLHYATPLSVVGAGGCSGSLLRIINRSGIATALIMRMRMGRAGFAYPPFRPAHDRRAGGEDDPPPSFAAMSASDGRCPACVSSGVYEGFHSPPDTPFHLLCECDHAAIAPIRTRMKSSATAMIARMCGQLRDAAARGMPSSSREHVAALVEAAIGSLPSQDAGWQTADGMHVLYRMLLVTPFPASVARDAAGGAGTLPITLALGALFDAIIIESYHLRLMAGDWATWSSTWGRELAAARRSILEPRREADESQSAGDSGAEDAQPQAAGGAVGGDGAGGADAHLIVENGADGADGADVYSVVEDGEGDSDSLLSGCDDS